MKSPLTLLFTLALMSGLTGCNVIQTNVVASACEQGIESLNMHLRTRSHHINPANMDRANSLLVAAKVQQQFAKYPSCVDKVKRAQDYLSGRQTAAISRLSI